MSLARAKAPGFRLHGSTFWAIEHLVLLQVLSQGRTTTTRPSHMKHPSVMCNLLLEFCLAEFVVGAPRTAIQAPLNLLQNMSLLIKLVLMVHLRFWTSQLKIKIAKKEENSKQKGRLSDRSELSTKPGKFARSMSRHRLLNSSLENPGASVLRPCGYRR